MKYTLDKPPMACIMTHSSCYASGRKIKPLGVLWHSTGVNNPTLRRYVQPYETDGDYQELITVLGKNRYRNDWNHVKNSKGVNAFVGMLADGTVAAVQTLPWDARPWGVASGKKGSCNNGWIQFEICEDALRDPDYFADVYREAVELTAYLCKLYGFDPHGTVRFSGVTVPVILCHRDSYELGLGNEHGDVLHWFGKYGKTMEDVRNDVAAVLAAGEGEDEDMLTGEEIFKRLNEYLLSQKPPQWVGDQGEFEKAIRNGITDGSEPTRLMTRYEGAIMNERVLEKARGE